MRHLPPNMGYLRPENGDLAVDFDWKSIAYGGPARGVVPWGGEGCFAVN